MRGLFLAIAGWLAFVATPVFAYPADVPTRSFDQKKPTDDCVVISVTGIDPNFDVWFSAREEADAFTIEKIDGSIKLVRTIPSKPGFEGASWTFTSLDRLHDTPSGTDKKFEMKLYFTADFLWIELTSDQAPALPVYSTVFFVGPPEPLVQKLLTSAETAEGYGAKFTSYDELKSSIQKNYADVYSPNYPLYIQYTREDMASFQIYRYNP